MTNKWIEHVKKYASEKGISYACALSQPDIKDGYEKVVKKTKKQLNEERDKIIVAQILNSYRTKIKNTSDENVLYSIKSSFLGMPKKNQDKFKELYPKYYEKLFSV